MKHATAPLPLLPRVQAHYLSGETLTAYPLALLMIPESYGDSIASDGSLPVACGVRLLMVTPSPSCSVCDNGPAAFAVEGWDAEGTDGNACAVCVLGDPVTPDGFGSVLALLPVSQVEGVETI